MELYLVEIGLKSNSGQYLRGGAIIAVKFSKDALAAFGRNGDIITAGSVNGPPSACEDQRDPKEGVGASTRLDYSGLQKAERGR